MDYSIKKSTWTGKLFLTGFILISLSFPVRAQQPATDSLLPEATLENVIQYALRRQPAIQQALANEQITENNIKSRLADWYPQVNFAFSFQHNFQLPVTQFCRFVSTMNSSIIMRCLSKLFRPNSFGNRGMTKTPFLLGIGSRSRKALIE